MKFAPKNSREISWFFHNFVPKNPVKFDFFFPDLSEALSLAAIFVLSHDTYNLDDQVISRVTTPWSFYMKQHFTQDKLFFLIYKALTVSD